jgi:hypothetical protein
MGNRDRISTNKGAVAKLAEAVDIAHRLGFDAFPDVGMPELIRGVPVLASRWRDGYADAQCDAAIYAAGLG